MTNLATLADCTDRCKTWSPAIDDPDGEFAYIDLSSVDKDTKRIENPASLACSDAPSRARQIVKAGDVLVSTVRPNLNGVATVPIELDGATASTGYTVLRPDPTKVDGSYLFHWVKHPAFVDEMVRLATGASYPAVSDKIVREAKIPLPQLREQRRIAAILDKADALRAKRREAIAKLEQLLQSLFFDMFGSGESSEHPRVPLDEAYWFQEGPGVRKWQFRGSGIKLLNVGNIEKDGSINLTKTDRHISLEEAHGKYKHFLVDDGDLVVASSGISFDEDGLLRTRGGFVSREHLPLCMNTSTIRFKSFAGKSVLRYLQVWINGRDFRRQITRLVTGSAQQNFGPSHLKQLLIPLPPIEKQEEFAMKATAISALKYQHEANLSRMDASFVSLQQAAFSGAL